MNRFRFHALVFWIVCPLACLGVTQEEKLLLEASKDGWIETVKFLLKSGMNPNTKDDAGDSALKLAALNGQTEVVKVLLEKGADPNIKDQRDRGILDQLDQDEFPEVAALLTQAGAVDARTVAQARKNEPPPLPPLIEAIKDGKPETAKYLLAKAANSDMHRLQS